MCIEWSAMVQSVPLCDATKVVLVIGVEVDRDLSSGFHSRRYRCLPSFPRACGRPSLQDQAGDFAAATRLQPRLSRASVPQHVHHHQQCNHSYPRTPHRRVHKGPIRQMKRVSALLFVTPRPISKEGRNPQETDVVSAAFQRARAHPSERPRSGKWGTHGSPT